MLYDVIIAGAGPVGLFLACELRLARCSVLVLEQASEPDSPLKRAPFGARGLTVPTVETLYRRGLLDDIVETPPPDADPSTARVPRRAGHFGGIPFEDDDIDTAQWRYRLPNPADTNKAADVETIENVLARRAVVLGVQIRRGQRVTDVTATDDAVTVHTEEHSFQGRWLVGCDGGRSTVRSIGGFEFVGTEPAFTGYMAQVDIADPATINTERTLTKAGMYLQPDPGVIAMLEFVGGAFHRTEPLSRDIVQATLRRVSGTNVTLRDMSIATTWTDRARQATAYRNGRILLAGDAAHIHSPLGAQGLNAGLGDAVNLGWKLAATIHGHAADGLLDSYFTERHPVGAQVLDWSRAQTAIAAPTPQARAIDAIIRDLIGTRAGATYFAERMWNASLRYDLGGGHPLTGRSAPDFELPDGTRLAHLLNDASAVLLDFDNGAPLQPLAARWGRRIKYVHTDVKDPMDTCAALVRPDGVIAWASSTRPHPADAEQAISRWFTPSQDLPD